MIQRMEFMHMIRRIAVVLCTVGLTMGATGCLLSGNYHSAKTLAKGQSSFGTTFSSTTFAIPVPDNDPTTLVDTNETVVTVPSLVPELTFHAGITDDLEIGGRVGVGQLAVEGDLKYRFLRSDRLHLAVAPSVGVQSFFVSTGAFLKVPVIATVDLSDNFAITGSVFANTVHYSFVDETVNSELSPLLGSLVSTGASFGIEINSGNFSIRPGFEYNRYLFAYDGFVFEPFNTISFNLHLSFTRG